MANMAEPKMAHVNLMVDTIISSLPEDGLRSVLRSMLATDPRITSVFEDRTRKYLEKTAKTLSLTKPGSVNEAGFQTIDRLQGSQQIVRAMLGCGMCYESLPVLSDIVSNAALLNQAGSDELSPIWSNLDGDIIQALTAIQKTLFTSSGTRPFTAKERPVLEDLGRSLQSSYSDWHSDTSFPFGRSLAAIESLLQEQLSHKELRNKFNIQPLPDNVETFKLGDKTLPRLFSGLWQLSSPSWGASSLESIMQQFSRYAGDGFVAYDMADHYGDAEIIFGKYRASCANPFALFGATKYCIFTPTNITKDVVQANITERCHRMSADHIDLLQFHWQDYNDKQYVAALKHLQDDPRVHKLGLCNFDTQHMAEIIEAGIEIYTNQVQFSLIDARPIHKMGPLCTQHNVRLLTYGTICGGFLSEKWLGKPEPTELFEKDITPSQRKYYEMILNWGSWDLFQELLGVLQTIAAKHRVSIVNVATRWVLDFDYVGAVIVGTRMGISDNAKKNLKAYGWRLNEEDRERIEVVLRKSRRNQLIELLGDCGGEYR